MIEEKKDTNDKGQLQRYWERQIKKEEKAHDDWRERASKIEKLYLAEKDYKERSKFNILYSNTQVLHSALYSASPKPDVRRRFLDDNKDARDLAELTERAISYCIDQENFSGVIHNVINDFLVSGLGQVRLRYEPLMKDGERPVIPLEKKEEFDSETNEPFTRYMDGENEVMSEFVSFDEEENPYTMGPPDQEKIFESIRAEVVPWTRFGWQPAKSWEDVNYCYIMHYLDEEELLTQFGRIPFDVPMYHNAAGETKKDSTGQEKGTHAQVFEIFDKATRRIIVLVKGMRQPLKVMDDGLNLEGFYPFPEPLITNSATNELMPIPDYVFYQNQANELDRLTTRIEKLTNSLKYRGAYDNSFPALGRIADSGDNQFVPIDDFAKLDNKGFDDVIKVMPLEELVRVISTLQESRERVKQTIYEITGISDIIRGASKASETLGAQQIKQRFAGLRLRIRQEQVEMFIRNIFRLLSEIYAEHFSPDTLEIMTGIKVTPQMTELMQSDLLRSYSIDVESESTIAQDASEEQKNRVELLTALTQFIAQAAPAVQAGILPIELAKELLLFGIRSFKGGRQIEDLLNQIGQQQQPAQPQGGLPPGSGGNPEQAGSQPGGAENVISMGRPQEIGGGGVPQF